ncbi:probable protein phosphatase 2c 34 [Phtheirospermum japonicum]|uniref:Probable protein phosphatase 2c 34 n=1 Tax=Phtheirospermum japonicum TaxID=374723 RepID=A0A830B1Y0_9LAMI|nr:probable protein phosphatase 2c 34 [Phtheirospermum japonicum]
MENIKFISRKFTKMSVVAVATSNSARVGVYVYDAKIRFWGAKKDEWCFSRRNDARTEVWDVISNQEVVEIVDSTPERAKSVKRLVERAVCAWKHSGRANVMDDISAIHLLFSWFDESDSTIG